MIPTNIFELTRALESYEDYVVDTAVDMANLAACVKLSLIHI